MLTGRIRRHELARRWPALPVAVILSVIPTPRVSDPPPPIEVVVAGLPRLVAQGSTVGRVLRVLGVEPLAGDLVDVEGFPLKLGSFPGSVNVGGKPAAADRILAPGDVVEPVDARDRIEPVRVEIVPVAEGGFPNPQAHVGAVPGEQVITTGAQSGKLVSSAFRPSGTAVPPPAVALTFDDGPSPRYTPRILRVLERFGVQATFFVVGYLAERYPAIVRETVRSGMALGNHSMNHPRMRPFADLPLHEVRSQIEGGHRVVESFGVASAGFRPPGGSWSNTVLDLAEDLSERIILWSVDSEDYEAGKPRVLARRVVRDAQAGSIILLHDGGGNRAATLRALPRIINGLRREGLGFVALG
jgi:peptidoglycan/xylan/chitin deacetylase (PgdA/CDA1 family)